MLGQWACAFVHFVTSTMDLYITYTNLISKENDRTKAKDMSFVKNRQLKNLSDWWPQKDVFEWLFLIIELDILIDNSIKWLKKHDMQFRLQRAIMKFWVFYIAFKYIHFLSSKSTDKVDSKPLNCTLYYTTYVGSSYVHCDAYV